MKTVSISSDQLSEVTIGCCNGQTALAGAAPGLPKSWRQAATVALNGFQSATVRNQAGIPCVGTNVFATNVSGNTAMKIRAFAASGVRTSSPTTVPTQFIAKPNSSSRPNAASVRA